MTIWWGCIICGLPSPDKFLTRLTFLSFLWRKVQWLILSLYELSSVPSHYQHCPHGTAYYVRTFFVSSFQIFFSIFVLHFPPLPILLCASTFIFITINFLCFALYKASYSLNDSKEIPSLLSFFRYKEEKKIIYRNLPTEFVSLYIKLQGLRRS